MNENNIKIVRMKSGEDIIASIFSDLEENVVLLNEPMTLFFKRVSSEQTILMMAPWLPVEVIQDNSAVVDSNEILTLCEPKQTLVEYYLSLVIELTERLEKNDKVFSEQFKSLMQENDEEEDDELEETPLIKTSRKYH